MGIKELNAYNDAVLNVNGMNILNFTHEFIFDQMKEVLLQAFDRETVFDMRSLAQITLIKELSSCGLTKEKDGKIYPYIKLALGIVDGYYDDATKTFKIYKEKPSEFELKCTPFNCHLDRFAQNTGGIYSRSDKNITICWRHFLKNEFPEWEGRFKNYLEDIKKFKIKEVEQELEEKIKKLNTEYASICDKLEQEYNSELATIESEQNEG